MKAVPPRGLNDGALDGGGGQRWGASGDGERADAMKAVPTTVMIRPRGSELCRAGEEGMLPERVLFVFHTGRSTLLALSVSHEEKSIHVEEEELWLSIRHCLNANSHV